jgi:hypothetical protein
MTNRILRIVLLLLWGHAYFAAVVGLLGRELFSLPVSVAGLVTEKFLSTRNDFRAGSHEHHVRFGSLPQPDPDHCHPLLTIRVPRRLRDPPARRFFVTLPIEKF